MKNLIKNLINRFISWYVINNYKDDCFTFKHSSGQEVVLKIYSKKAYETVVTPAMDTYAHIKLYSKNNMDRTSFIKNNGINHRCKNCGAEFKPYIFSREDLIYCTECGAIDISRYIVQEKEQM